MKNPIIFMNEEKRKEWEELDPSIRKNVYSLLQSCTEKMEMKITIEILCNVIIDMDERIQKLERNLVMPASHTTTDLKK